jgi:hypothetical protein
MHKYDPTNLDLFVQLGSLTTFLMWLLPLIIVGVLVIWVVIEAKWGYSSLPDYDYYKNARRKNDRDIRYSNLKPIKVHYAPMITENVHRKRQPVPPELEDSVEPE